MAHFSSFSPNLHAQARIQASTASACFRRLSLLVYSHNSCQTDSRSTDASFGKPCHYTAREAKNLRFCPARCALSLTRIAASFNLDSDLFQARSSARLERYLDTVEVWGSSPHGPTISSFLFFIELVRPRERQGQC